MDINLSSYQNQAKKLKKIFPIRGDDERKAAAAG
jgi:hypothetical protein